MIDEDFESSDGELNHFIRQLGSACEANRSFAVQSVTDERMSYVRHVHTKLMGSERR
eukprot:gene24209-30528_t